MRDIDAFDLDAYLARVGYSGPRDAGRGTLDALHLAHLGAVPFENLDVLLGRRIRLDIPSLEAKLVRARRGGYCFEQNTLFAAALRTLGFRVGTLEARVRPPDATRTLPRTHMVLRVDLDGRALLADVGFGGDGPLRPLGLGGEVSEQGLDSYRVVEEDAIQVLQILREGGWRDLYAFRLDEALPVDFEVANHYTSTWPESPFVTKLTAQLSLPDERRILRDRTFTVRRGGSSESREIDEHELVPLLRRQFGIEPPPGTRLPAPPSGPG